MILNDIIICFILYLTKITKTSLSKKGGKMKKLMNVSMITAIILTMFGPMTTFANEKLYPLVMVSEVGTVEVNLDGVILTTDYLPFDTKVIKANVDEIQILNAQNG